MKTSQGHSPGCSATSVGRPDRRELALLLVILLLGGTLRLLYLAEIRHSPELAYPPVDAGFSLYWARGLATGNWTLPAEARGRDPGIRDRAFPRPPGYPYVLAALYRVTEGRPAAIRALQMIGGLLGVVLAWWLGRRLFDPPTALVWAALLASNWTLIFFEGGLHGAWLVILVSLVLVMALHRLALDPTPLWSAAVGAIVGLLALLRPNLLVVAPLLFLWGLWVTRSRTLPKRIAAMAAAAAIAGCLVLAPALVHNWSAERALVPVSANGGITLYHGNNPNATAIGVASGPDRRYTTPWQIPDLVRVLEDREGRTLSLSQASRVMGNDALKWMRQNPLRALVLVGRRALLFWGPDEVAHNHAIAADRLASPLLRRLPMPFSLALAGAIVGVASAWRRTRAARRARSAPLPPSCVATQIAIVLVVLACFGSYLPFFVTSLYRLPVVPWLLLGCGVAVVEVARLMRSNRRQALAMAAAIAALWLVLRIPLIPVDPGIAKRHIIRGQAWLQLGRPQLAENELRAATAASPRSAEAYAGLGAALINQGRHPEARSALSQAASLDPADPVTHFNLGVVASQTGGWHEAVQAFALAAELEPCNADTHANLGVSFEQLGRHRDAIAAYRKALEHRPGHLQAANNLAWLLATSSDPELRDGPGAVEIAESLVGTTSTASTLDTLAAAYAESGRFDDAVVTAQRALAAPGLSPRLEDALRSRLAEYREHRPHREPPAQ